MFVNTPAPLGAPGSYFMSAKKTRLVFCVPRLVGWLKTTQVGWEGLPKSNRGYWNLKLTANAPENGWFEYDRFLLGPGLFSGAFAVSFRECLYFLFLRGFCLEKICKRSTKKHKAFLTDLVDDAGFVFSSPVFLVTDGNPKPKHMN